MPAKKLMHAGWVLVLVLLAGGVVWSVAISRSGSTHVDWSTNKQAALARAQKENKPVLLYFHTASCGWCARMDRETWNDPNVVDETNRMVAVSIDADKDKQAVIQYRVIGFPTIVVLKPNGTIDSILSGYRPTGEMLEELKGIK